MKKNLQNYLRRLGMSEERLKLLSELGATLRITSKEEKNEFKSWVITRFSRLCRIRNLQCSSCTRKENLKHLKIMNA